jgi:hypothetical protein
MDASIDCRFFLLVFRFEFTLAISTNEPINAEHANKVNAKNKTLTMFAEYSESGIEAVNDEIPTRGKFKASAAYLTCKSGTSHDLSNNLVGIFQLESN